MALRLEEQVVSRADQDPRHPLDPLSASELAAAAAAIRAHLDVGDDLRVETIDLDEPAKELVRAFRTGDPIPRVARFHVYRRGVMGVHRGRVDLATGRVHDLEFVPEARAMVSLDEVAQIEAVVKADPRFQAALARRGILDLLEHMAVDPWTVGDFGVPIEKGRRVMNCFIWTRLFPLDNYYAHPVEGLNVLVDLGDISIIEVVDHGEAGGDVVPLPRTPLNFDRDLLSGFRPPSAPLDVVQPKGAGFRVDGHHVSWESWDFRVGFNGREGLSLHCVAYTDKGVRRPILYRASIAEMVVPYGTPEPAHHRKNVFDSGELGFGRMANTLELGCDCLGVIHYFDAVVADLWGRPKTIRNAICLHEEDAGMSWKHYDWRSGRTEVRRSRRLVVSSISTIGNYEYASYWYLYQDGRIEYEMKATGIINTAACHPGRPGKWGTEVAPGLRGHIHQHIFCARLDVEIDGPTNSVVECDTLTDPAFTTDNPYGNAFYVDERVLRRESEAQRDVDFERMRFWKIINPRKTNWVGTPTGYRLEATSPVKPFTHPDSPSGKRGRFIRHQLWVTPYDPKERFPSGEFVNQSDGSDGIETWMRADRPIVDTDIVVWHCFGLHHPVRPEDHPVQPCVVCGFKLLPSGFFDQNPVIDLPPERNAASRSHHGSCCGDA